MNQLPPANTILLVLWVMVAGVALIFARGRVREALLNMGLILKELMCCGRRT